MNNLIKRIVASIILILIILATIMPTVNAVSENILQNKTKENLLYQKSNDITNNETKDYNTDTKGHEETVTSFDVLMADILTKKEGNSFKINDVPSIILQKPSKNGVWIEEKSREYFINLINSLTNKTYKVNSDGFLSEDLELVKERTIVKEEYNFFTEKVDEMISQEKLTIICISEAYKQLNEIDNDIIDVKVENDEYCLLFKDNEEKEITKQNIIILNSKNYTLLNTTDSYKYLFKKFLESYYYDNEEFLDYINLKNDSSKDENYTEDNNKLEDNDILENNTTENTVKDNTIIKDNIKSNSIDEQIVKTNIFDDRVTQKDWNLILADILSNHSNITKENVNEILESQPISNGIWISPNSRNSFINFLNQYTIYTYSVDNNGFLACNNIMKTNQNLDIIENSETDVDIIIKKLISSNTLLVVDLASTYLTYGENAEIVNKQLANEDYTKSFSCNGNRILLLNPTYYNTTEYDLSLSDYLIKSMQNIQEKVLSGEINISKEQPLARSSRDIIGYSESSQNVYAGPYGSNYATIGSVSAGEKLYILGTNAGWYHIQYVITGTNNGDGVELEKSGYIPIGTLSSISGIPSEENFTGGQAYPKQNLEVQTCDDFDISTKMGSVSSGEGVTILYDYTYSDWTGKSYRVALIEYSTSSGTKRGYVYKDQLDNASYPTSVARVIDTNAAYTGPDNSFVKLGGAYYNEYVTVLAKNTGNDWVFVEYNTSSGRKRGYMSYTKLSNCNYPGSYNDLATNKGLKQATQQLTVYGGPSNNNANIGAIFSQEIVSIYGTEKGYAYVEYSTTNGAKRGYVLASALTDAAPPSLPTIPTYANFTSGTYGTSGLGQSLKYYKIGNGPNVAFAVFAQHGWEDAWAYDGIELVNIANRLMSNLSSSGISNNWTLYIIPYANPDGITNGYTNNGPGRCTVTTSIDMNRCWPTNFTASYTSRNYTGDSPLGATEAVTLKNFIENNMGSNQKIILDIHGWLNQTYGSSEIGQYFDEQFGFGHSSTYGSGYLMAWGKSIGAKSCLVEFPMPSSSADIINRDFSGKLTNAIKNMLNETNGESGIQVYEQVKVNSSIDLNVRSGPGTSYSIVTTVPPDTVVIRIKKSVASANGLIWDKIRLSNGTEGYVATNYLLLVGEENTLSGNDVKIVKSYCKFNKINNYSGEINSTYDNEIYFAIQEFQRINELSQTGYVNANTWNTMELNKSDIYSLYQTISNNYINYNNPYGPSFYEVPNSDYGTKFEINKKETIMQQQSDWDVKANNYNNMSSTDRIIKASQMSSTENTLKVIATASANIFPHASNGIVHYLSNTGTVHIMSDGETSQFLNGSQGRKDLVETYTQHSKNAIEYMLTINKTADFSMEKGMPLKLSELELDWFGFLGNYYFYVNGNCYKRGNQYSIAGQYNIKDYYDFDTVEGLVEIINSIKQGDVDDVLESKVGDLHYAGKAKFYYIEGSTSFIAQWSK